MSNQSFIQPAQRIASFKPYFFASLNQRLAALKARGVDIIRIDMGSPDLPPANFIIETLIAAARRPDTHGYTPNGGIPAFREAIATYYRRRFGVELDPMRETLGLIGSKEGLFNLAQVLLNPGDVSLVPDPGYPVYEAASIIAGAQVIKLPLMREHGFLPQLEALSEEILDRAKVLWLNYPNNPTGAIAPMEYLEQVVALAKRHHFVIAYDAPYTDICFDGYRAPSILQIPGAREVAIEFNSLSKTYNMAGWRVGMAVGNADLIQYLHVYKSQIDSSHFQPILLAAIAALTGDQSWIEERNLIYRQRRDLVVQALRQCGFDVQTPPAAIYVWAHLPPGLHDSTSFCERLLEETGVSMTPGVVYGEYGEGYVRISLGAPTERLDEAMQRLLSWIKRA